MTKQFTLILFLIVGTLGVSCGGVKPATAKGSQNLFETFYVGDEGTQYYIKPLDFKQEKEKLKVDITFRYKDEVKDSASINITLLGSKFLKEINAITFENPNARFTSKQVELMFNDVKNKGYASRFTTRVPLSQVYPLFLNSDWKISIEHNKGKETYMPTSKAQKSIGKLQRGLFVLFE